MTEPTATPPALPPPPSVWSPPLPSAGASPPAPPGPPVQQPYPSAPHYGQQGPPPPGYGYGYQPHVNQVFVQQVAAAPVFLMPTKSVGLSLVLTFFFGPFGMLYSTVLGGVVMFFVELLVGVATFGLGLVFTWPICMLWAALAANGYNNRILSGRGLR